MVVEVLLFCNHTTWTPCTHKATMGEFMVYQNANLSAWRLKSCQNSVMQHAAALQNFTLVEVWILTEPLKHLDYLFFSLSQPCCRCAAVLGLIVLLHDPILGKLKPQTSMNWSSIVKTSGHKFICNYARDWKTSDSKLRVISTSRELQGTEFICVFHTVLLHVGIVLLNNGTV